jgi:hypothetical protein
LILQSTILLSQTNTEYKTFTAFQELLKIAFNKLKRHFLCNIYIKTYNILEMKISKLKSAIREMIISELNEAEFQSKAGEVDKIKDRLKPGDTVKVVAEDEALNEMAKIAGDLKVAIEKVIEKNKDGEKKDIRKAIKTDDDVQAALGPDDDLFDNQLNKFIDLVRGEREVGQRGRKADPNKPEKEKKEGGMRGRPKSATPKMSAAAKKATQKTYKMGDDRKYYADDKEGPSDAELRSLASSGGKVEKSKISQLRQQEKTKMVKAFLKGLRDKGVVDAANRVLDKEIYAAEWAKAKPAIDAAIAKLK